MYKLNLDKLLMQVQDLSHSIQLFTKITGLEALKWQTLQIALCGKQTGTKNRFSQLQSAVQV